MTIIFIPLWLAYCHTALISLKSTLLAGFVFVWKFNLAVFKNSSSLHFVIQWLSNSSIRHDGARACRCSIFIPREKEESLVAPSQFCRHLHNCFLFPQGRQEWGKIQECNSQNGPEVSHIYSRVIGICCYRNLHGVSGVKTTKTPMSDLDDVTKFGMNIFGLPAYQSCGLGSGIIFSHQYSSWAHPALSDECQIVSWSGKKWLEWNWNWLLPHFAVCENMYCCNSHGTTLTFL